MNVPRINVTPLIDVLLVLLIIFMVASPLKPTAFKARIPALDKQDRAEPNDLALVITVGPKLELQLNGRNAGILGDEKVRDLLKDVFNERVAKGAISESFADDPDRPGRDRIERTVFIKAPRSINYGAVARAVDEAKLAGAFPISLQIDALEN